MYRIKEKLKLICASITKKLKWKQNLLLLYLFIVGATQIFLNIYDTVSKSELLGNMCIYLGIYFLLLLFVCPKLIELFKKIKIKKEEVVAVNRKEKIKWIITFLGISFSILLLRYLASCPGGFSPDSLTQYQQAITGEYSDWHPVLHTLVIFKFPLKLTGTVEAIVLFQIIYFALILAYMAYTILLYSNRKYAVFSLLVVLLNPFVLNIVMYPWKDVAFAMGTLLLMVYALKIYFTNGEWMNSWLHMLLFSVVSVMTMLFRHNAILFVLPLIIGVLLYKKQKKTYLIVILVLMLTSLIKGPVYSSLEVESPGSRQIETLGLPMTVIANVVKEHPESLDNETKEFVYSIGSQEIWEMCSVGNFNSVKWAGTNLEPIEEAGVLKVLKITGKCFMKEPASALRGLFALTDMVYQIDDNMDWRCVPSVIENSYGIEYTGNTVLQNFFNGYYKVIQNSVLKYIFLYVGVINLIVVLGILSKFDSRTWKRSFLCIPLLVYNFGTMLLLTGNDIRFFCLNFMIWPVILLILARDENPDIQSQLIEK